MYPFHVPFCFSFHFFSLETDRTIQASEHDIRLEDFFWNGSGDEPLTLSLKSNARLTMNGFLGRETFIKTATVIATVYVGEDSVIRYLFQFQRFTVLFYAPQGFLITYYGY